MELLQGFLSTTFECQLSFLVTVFVTLGAFYCGYVKFKTASLQGRNLPPGSLGFPVIGESIGFLSAMKKNNRREWVERRMKKYGPVFKTSLMGSHVVILTGQAGNKLIFSANDAITSNQTMSTAAIFGKHSIFELEGSRHKLLRSVMMNYLKPDNLQKYVVQMDSIVKQRMLQELQGKDSVQFAPLIKKVTFDISCSILFGLPEGMEKDVLFHDSEIAITGSWALPLDIPGTPFRKARKARARICEVLSNLIKRRMIELEDGNVGSQEDVITSFLNLRDEEGKSLLEEEIIDNLLTLIFGHRTTAILLYLFLRYVGKDSHVYNKVLEEQKEVVKAKAGSDGKLEWSEMQSMKYTWRVAQELMRLNPPVFGNFRYTIKDLSFDGFDIPKGWRMYWVSCATHMDEKIFQAPETFDPSRFESPSKSIPPYTYIPFGAGSRICPGSDFARFEMLMIIHHLMMNYKWTTMIPDEPMVSNPTPYPAVGFPVKLHPMKEREDNV